MQLAAQYLQGMQGRERTDDWLASKVGTADDLERVNANWLTASSLKLDLHLNYDFSEWQAGIDVKNIAALFNDDAKLVHSFDASNVGTEAWVWALDDFHLRLFAKTVF